MDQVIQSLQELQCPLPSDPFALLHGRWSELLGWLLRSLDSASYERLVDVSSSSPDYHHFCVVFGLCSAKDVSLVKGSAKEQDKVQFLRTLTELVKINTPETASQIGASQQLLADVVADSRAILSKQVSIFPADMDPIYSVKNGTVPSYEVEALISTAKSTLKELEQTLSTHDVSKLVVPSEAHRTDIGALKKEVHEQFERLQMMMRQFEAVYALDVRPWCREEGGSALIGLGPAATQLLELQTSLHAALSNLKHLKSNYSDMTANDSAVDVAKCDLEINEQSILAVQEQCSILEKALLRRQEVGVL